MHVHPDPRPDTGDAAPQSGDESHKRAIARAVWTEIHWLFPRDRRVTVAVDGDDVAVEFGPPRKPVPPAAH